MELLRADDPNAAWVDVTDCYRSGLKDLEGGTYTVRLTNGAGVQAEASVQVEAPHGTQVVPDPDEPDPDVPDPDEPVPVGPDGPDAPDGSDLAGTDGGSDGTGATQPASAAGDGRVLAPTGDPFRAVFAAGCAVAAACAVVATAALLRLRRNGRR